LTVTENCLASNPDVQGEFVAANDDVALGAIEAAKAAGVAHPDHPGFDALPEAKSRLSTKARSTVRVERFPGEPSAHGAAGDHELHCGRDSRRPATWCC
jgi:hypothetical protein